MNHPLMVASLKKEPQSIVDEFNTLKADAMHMAVGISKESGELLDSIARAVFYNKDIDLDNIKEELGDIEFFLEGIRQTFSISREETLNKNMAKLGVRYGSGRFSNDQANARADKEPGQ